MIGETSTSGQVVNIEYILCRAKALKDGNNGDRMICEQFDNVEIIELTKKWERKGRVNKKINKIKLDGGGEGRIEEIANFVTTNSRELIVSLKEGRE